jgi:RimJ/RimL family protein N-acetyltransferase
VTAPRIRLREPRDDDAPVMFAYRTDPDVTRYQSWVPASVGEIRAMIAAQAANEPYRPGVWHQLAIAAAATDELLGDCGIHRDAGEPREARFGISLATAHQRRGYASEAVDALLAVAFEHVGLHRVVLSIDPRNARSVALAERAGFRREAHHVESFWDGTAWVDDLIYAMLRRDWDARRSAPGAIPGS